MIEKLTTLIIFIFDGIKDIIDIWLDKKISFLEKLDDTIFQITSILFCVILIIFMWNLIL